MSEEPPKNRLRPRARIMRTLGQELISNEVVAVIELVKNAYDADATKVLIRFVGPLLPTEGRIEVLDNGHGMSLPIIQTVFLEPATVSKRAEQRSEKLKRRYLGEKGIGRFASARLAEELEVSSRREDAPSEAYAFFDWRQFDDDAKFLEDVEILTEDRTPKEICPSGTIKQLWANDSTPASTSDLSHGTLLRMSSLRQAWGEKEFQELTRGLSRLIAPTQQNGSSAQASKFELFLELPAELSHFNKKIEPPAILKHPHYLITGNVTGDGSYNIKYSVLSTGEEVETSGRYLRVLTAKNTYEFRAIASEETNPPETFLPISCGPLSFELRIWDRDELGNVVQKTRSTIRDIRRDLDAVAGINIYRDGFRVLPYGEPRDDWLRLDLRRVQNPTLRLSNNQIHGVVSITADGNPELRDQSNREGLDENQGVEDLRDLLSETLARLEQLRYAARPRNTNNSNKPVGGLFTPFDLAPLEKHLAQTSPNDTAALEILGKAEKAFDGQLKEIQTVLSRYQRLATLGQLIDHMLHEGRQPIASINNEAYLGLKDAGNISSAADGATLVRRFTTIRKQGDILAIAFRRMEPFGGRRRGRPAQLYLEEIIKDAFDVFEDDIQKLGVSVDLPTSQTLVRVDPAEMQEVVINLLQNSLYWLQQVRKDSRAILVTVVRHDADYLDIYFSDSGPGVPKENRQLIFDPYFSTRSEGVGLGLAIVGEIVSDYYGGGLQLLEDGPLSGANFLITLRKRV